LSYKADTWKIKSHYIQKWLCSIGGRV